MAAIAINKMGAPLHGNVKLMYLHAVLMSCIARSDTGLSELTGSLAASMAEFDAALRQVLNGSTGRYGIEWDRNPNDVFRALDNGGELPPSEGMPCYFVEVAADIPGLVCCTRFA